MKWINGLTVGMLLTGYVQALAQAPAAAGSALPYKGENLGPQVNSTYNEGTPLISPDGKTLYYTREDHPNNTMFADKDNGSTDIWYSDWQPSNQWGPARRLGAPLNQFNHNAVFSITPDGNSLLLRGAYVNGRYETRGFSVSKRVNGNWSTPEKMVIANYEKMSKGAFDFAYLTVDGKTLLLSFSEKKNGLKDDLYVSFRQKNGTWSQPMNLGADVNTEEFTETTPFLAPDGNTLYFSTNRPGGQGDNDVWVTRRVDKTWKRWSKPQNLGPTVNTDGYDAYYSISALGDMAYMTTFKNTQGGKGGDIVQIKLFEDTNPRGGTDSTTLAQNPAKAGGGGDNNPAADDLTRPGAVAMISGKVIDQKTGRPIAAEIIYNTLPDGAEAGRATADPATGEYKIILPYGQKYTMRAVTPNYIAEGENVDLTGGPTDKKGFVEIKGRELKLVPIEVGQSIRLNNIFFDTGKSILRDESAPELDRMVVVMNENPKLGIELGGHTDNTGSNEINAKLSQDRADAVREYLIGKGVEPDRIASKGYGETKPVAPNDSDAGRQQNRRVEFVITKK
ncbi:OmpA family protein [Fibrella aquatica]|uniref:OmpA family protein n=1 Tax=Fibrella aquatica TaxID=3242487 RepID=UPI003522A818